MRGVYFPAIYQVGRLPSNLKPIQLEIPLGFNMKIEEIQGFCTEIQGFCAQKRKNPGFRCKNPGFGIQIPKDFQRFLHRNPGLLHPKVQKPWISVQKPLNLVKFQVGRVLSSIGAVSLETCPPQIVPADASHKGLRDS